ncbi:beta-N-acetylglucosaminidase domain-containing protein [Rhizomonospora bruguierae]|uniref:beta-N-acetylglucosaminidase domain-containing protein n=1 Tax=Rhizomonospora bruguierae TaxID=1581705 RepID=UPI001BD1113F|nr:beta-N-acetylglucosaminidase domain-containing protein [Micromonospora sp. NBRC 107566]
MSASPHPATPGHGDPELPVRGTVEGFYGPPWSHAERLAHLEFSARVGLNTYVYAPKDDPHHRARWRQPYPEPELARLAELAAASRALGIRFVYAISPGLSMRFADDADHRALAAKAGQVFDAGIGHFALFFDDVPAELTRPEELNRWPGAGAAGAAHGEAAATFVAGFLRPRGIREPLLVCPTDYAGCDATPYRERFARTAPPDAIVAWTGCDIVTGAVTRDDVARAAASYRRRVLLWDNFPVNDYEPSRLFLGPLTGRAGELGGGALAGVLANPMVQAVPSRIPLACVADWARDPRGYDPAASARRALAAVAGAGAADLAPLVEACTAWPPEAEQEAALARAVGDALAGRPGGLDVLTGRLTDLARGCRAAREPEPLVTALRPWLDAAIAMADAGLAAARLLQTATVPQPPAATVPQPRAVAESQPRAAAESQPQAAIVPQPRAGASGEVEALREEVRRALGEAERHYANVLRSVIPPFVREVLDRTAPAESMPAEGRPAALLVTGDRRTAGDEAVADLLARRGFAVRRRALPGPEEIREAAAVVVTRGAGDAAIAAVARVDVPLLAWHGFVPLGLATSGVVLLARDRVRIAEPADPLAAGLAGAVPVYRGPGKLTVAEVGPDARVVARVVDEDRPALFHYPAGATLADGTVAPAPRIGLFLGADGPAPWLMGPAGRVIVEAAFDRLATGSAVAAIPRPSPAGDLAAAPKAPR